MNLLNTLSILGLSLSSGLDDMLRFVGVAAIIHVIFKGVRSLLVKPAVAQLQAPVAPSPALEPVSAKPLPEATDDVIPSEIIAVIAAAVSCFTSSNHRIVSIRRQSSTWERAGRQSVLTSHRIR
jgi:hypothetical protein